MVTISLPLNEFKELKDKLILSNKELGYGPLFSESPTLTENDSDSDSNIDINYYSLANINKEDLTSMEFIGEYNDYAEQLTIYDTEDAELILTAINTYLFKCF